MEVESSPAGPDVATRFRRSVRHDKGGVFYPYSRQPEIRGVTPAESNPGKLTMATHVRKGTSLLVKNAAPLDAPNENTADDTTRKQLRFQPPV
jgi:hypothetical protein